MKSQMNGFGDPALREFSLLDSSALLKDEFKEEKFENEFIKSFLNAAKVLASAGRKAVDTPVAYVLYEHSYALPVMFLTRHCMELAIKRAIKKCGFEPKKTHKLRELWNSLVSRLPSQRSYKDERTLADMDSFLGVVSDVDNDGIGLRYPKDGAGNLTQDRPLFVNNEAIVFYLEKFVEQLELIDFETDVEDIDK